MDARPLVGAPVFGTTQAAGGGQGQAPRPHGGEAPEAALPQVAA
jgi:hypothetical protein